MQPALTPPATSERLVAYYRSGDTLRSRSVGARVLSGRVEIPAPSPRLLADWRRDVVEQLALEPGDVEPLNLHRARLRWPDYRQCVQALTDWTRGIGLQEVLASADQALMACRGARYHLDAARYGAVAFCNLFVSEDQGLDLHFPATGQRLPLERGTVVVFDTGQPHAVVDRHQAGFRDADFAHGRDRTLVFLTWELPIEQTAVAQALDIHFDVDAATALRLHDEQVWHQGAPAQLCPFTGRWR